MSEYGKIRMCPKCKSKNIKNDMSALALNREFAPPRFICNDCGYEGISFSEMD